MIFTQPWTTTKLAGSANDRSAVDRAAQASAHQRRWTRGAIVPAAASVAVLFNEFKVMCLYFLGR